MVSQDALHTDPEVDGLLREIAADPRSSLFKFGAPRNPMSWAEYTEPLSPWTPDLTTAERHLLRVHRADVAQLLRERWGIELILRPPGRVHIVVGESAQEPGAKVFAERWREKAHGQPELVPGTQGDLLLRMGERAPLGTEDLSELVHTAMRLDPSNCSRIYLAQDSVRRGELRSARTVLAQVLSTEPDPSLAVHGWMGIAQIESMRGNLRNARDLYDSGVKASPGFLVGMASSILLSAQVGDREALLSKGRALDELGPAHDPALDAFVAGEARTRAAGVWSASQEGVQLARRLQDHVGASTRRVLGVFL